MNLANNGRASISKRTRHINVQNFFLADRIKSSEMKIEYFPTLDMIGVYFTKPLQGSLLRQFHNIILVKEGVDVTKYNAKSHERIK